MGAQSGLESGHRTSVGSSAERTHHARHKLDANLVDDALAGPLAARHPHDLLRCARALDNTLGLGKDRLAPGKVLNTVPDLVAVLVAVDRADARRLGALGEGLGQALDCAKVGLEARADNQVVVSELGARLERERVGRRRKGGRVRRGEGEVRRDQRRQRPAEVLLLGETGADECPPGLVVVVVGALMSIDLKGRSA